jgi:hypothetical protein
MTTEEQITYVRRRLEQLFENTGSMVEPRTAESVRQNNQQELNLASRLYRETVQHCKELNIELRNPCFRVLYNYDAELGVEVLYEITVLYDIVGVKVERQMATFRVDTAGAVPRWPD